MLRTSMSKQKTNHSKSAIDDWLKENKPTQAITTGKITVFNGRRFPKGNKKP